jgi:hypothetical protein
VVPVDEVGTCKDTPRISVHADLRSGSFLIMNP